MQAEGGLAIVRARLPYIDRRALPEAWFSALHLAVTPRRRARNTVAHLGERSGKAGPAATACSRSARSVTGASPLRATRSDLTRRPAAPALPHAGRKAAPLRSKPAPSRSYPPARVAFTVGLDGARVQLLVRREGAVLHVVARCNERHVALVRGALAEAAAHLSRRGDLVSSSVRPFVRVAG